MFNARQEKNVGVRPKACGEHFPVLLLASVVAGAPFIADAPFIAGAPVVT